MARKLDYCCRFGWIITIRQTAEGYKAICYDGFGERRYTVSGAKALRVFKVAYRYYRQFI